MCVCIYIYIYIYIYIIYVCVYICTHISVGSICSMIMWLMGLCSVAMFYGCRVVWVGAHGTAVQGCGSMSVCICVHAKHMWPYVGQVLSSALHAWLRYTACSFVDPSFGVTELCPASYLYKHNGCAVC